MIVHRTVLFSGKRRCIRPVLCYVCYVADTNQFNDGVLTTAEGTNQLV